MKKIILILILLFSMSFVYALPNRDLVISALSFSKNPAYEGEIVAVTITTKNIGTASVGASTTRLANGNATYFNVSALAGNTSQTNYLNYTCGTVNVTFTGTADYYNAVKEINEANNHNKS